jgi:hypothetical protein
MAPNRMIARWLRPALALFALGGLLALGGCGGGSGAPNNPFAPGPSTPGPLSVLPAIVTAYSNSPVTLTISGGAPPYFVVSSNSAVLPVAQSSTNGTIVLLPGNVAADTAVTITVQDAIGQRATSTVTVKAAPIFGTLTIKPASAACGPNTICSGQTGTVTVTVMGPSGSGVAGRQVRFDVVDGDFGIQSNNPATPLVQTLTVVSDSLGVATVVIQANAGAPTQPAFIRATDLTSGNQVTGQFTIVQTINGSAVLSVVPSTVTFTGVFTDTCFSGGVVDYYIFGGTPPYHVNATIPGAVFLANTVVATSGGSFRATTTGLCVNPLLFSIVDATGLQTTATLNNVPGTTPPTPPPVAPALNVSGGFIYLGSCEGQISNFVILGGTPPYNAFFATPPNPGAMITPQLIQKEGQGFSVSGLKDTADGGQLVTNITVTDSSSPQQFSTRTIQCP